MDGHLNNCNYSNTLLTHRQLIECTDIPIVTQLALTFLAFSYRPQLCCHMVRKDRVHFKS